MRTIAFIGCWLLGTVCLADDASERSLALLQQQQPRAGAVDETADAEASQLAEKKLLEFVKQHQPKLLALMSFLKQKQPAAYEQALKELGRNQQRLESLAKRDQQLYAVELELWRIRTQLRLLAAEISVAKPAPRETLETQLGELVRQELQQDLERLQILRERAAQQLARFDEDIRQRSDNQDELVAKSLKSWQNRIKKQTTRGSKQNVD